MIGKVCGRKWLWVNLWCNIHWVVWINVYKELQWHGGGWGGSDAGGSMQGVAELIFMVKNEFLLSKMLQLLSRVKGSSINDCDLLKGKFLLGIAIVCTPPPRRPKAYLRHCVQTFGWKN